MVLIDPDLTHGFQTGCAWTDVWVINDCEDGVASKLSCLVANLADERSNRVPKIGRRESNGTSDRIQGPAPDKLVDSRYDSYGATMSSA